jgi:hypothetical protein
VIKILDREIRVKGRMIRTARIEGDKYRFLDNPEAIIQELRRRQELRQGSPKLPTRVDVFTFMQRLPDSSPRFSYPMEWDNFAAIRVTTFEEWWNNQIGFKARNKAKQAEKKGVVLREVPFGDELARGIWNIYEETPIRQGRRFPNYGKTLETVTREASTFLDASVFIGAYFEDKLIGFVKLTADETGTQAGLMHIVSMIQHRDKAPTNALVAHAVRACANRGIQYLVYSNFAYGNKERDTLSDFKERNGFQRIEVPRYYVPLTPLGRLALRLGLHRELIAHLPEPLMAKLRRYRTAWYNRKFGLSKEAV